MAFKMKGFSAFTKKTDKDYEPQTKTRGYKSQIKKRAVLNSSFFY